jgi:cephalosporin hydroxylase
MKYILDTDSDALVVASPDGDRSVPLYSTEGFELLSDLWLKVGWNQKHVYTFSWFGRPIIQLPEDLIRVQEVLHTVRPDVIVECGVAHGGALVYYASLCRILGHGRVVGVDVEIRPHNRAALETHPLADLLTLIEGSSTDPETLALVAAEIKAGETALVMLDSAHDHDHVLAELEAYNRFVSSGSYLIVMDGIMELAADTPRGQPDWAVDNPLTAVDVFLRTHPEFAVEQPPWSFNESRLRRNVTHWPSGYLRKVS